MLFVFDTLTFSQMAMKQPFQEKSDNKILVLIIRQFFLERISIR